MSGDTHGVSVSDPGGTRHGEPRGWLRPPQTSAQTSQGGSQGGTRPVPRIPQPPEADVHVLPTAYLPTPSLEEARRYLQQVRQASASGVSGYHAVGPQRPEDHTPPVQPQPQQQHDEPPYQQPQQPPSSRTEDGQGPRLLTMVPLTPRQWMERYGTRFPSLGQALRAMPHGRLDWSEDDHATAYELRAMVEAFFAAQEARRPR